MIKPKFKNEKEMLSDVRKLAKKWGECPFQWIIRKWDKSITQRRILLKEKAAIEKELKANLAKGGLEGK